MFSDEIKLYFHIIIEIVLVPLFMPNVNNAPQQTEKCNQTNRKG